MAAAAATPAPSKPAKAAPAKKVPQRTCVACRTTGGKKGLLRVVRLPRAVPALTAARAVPALTAGAGVVLDPTGKVSGRGAYVCATPECIGLAIKQKKLERSLKTALPEETISALKAIAVMAAEEQAKQAEQAV